MLKQISWNRQTKIQKRKTIVRDALKHIKSRTFVVKQGIYVRIAGLTVGEEVRDMIPTRECHVCAKGALFLEHVSKFNECKVGWAGLSIDDEDIKKRLGGIFSETQLDLIEAAFEKRLISTGNTELNTGTLYRRILTPIAKTAIAFGKQYRNKTERLEAILKKTLRNKNGEFHP